MKSQAEPQQATFTQQGDELPLSGPALAAMLAAVLDRGVPFRFRARGWSMSPFIKDGDVITVRPLEGRAPRLGEIVAFIPGGQERVVVHRVVGRSGPLYLIQGDALPRPDHAEPVEHILGRVAAIERSGRTVMRGLGPERVAIALLTRSGLFSGLVVPLWLRLRPLVRRLP